MSLERFAAVLACLFVAGPHPGLADDRVPDERRLSALCLDCHRSELAPHVEGQHAPYLALQLRSFRDRHRESFPMSAIASAFDDRHADAWAASLAARAWPASAGLVGSDSDRAAGAALGEARGCSDCHGEALLGAVEVPRLAGQRAAYLERQIAGFARGDRFHAPLAGGTRMRAMDADEARQLAAWLASQPAR